MDNQNSRPSIVPPSVPADANSRAGTSKSDLIEYIFELLRGATITGIQSDQPTPYDLAALTNQVTAHEVEIDKIKDRTPRRVIVSGVNDGPQIVTFQDVGTTNYQVDASWVTPNVNFGAIQWSIIDGSKLSSQVTLRIDGSAGAYMLEVTITPMDGI